MKLSEVQPEAIWLYIKQIHYVDLVSDFGSGMDKLIGALRGEAVSDGPQALRSKITGEATLRRYLPFLFSNPLRGREDDLRRLRESLTSGVVQVTGTGGRGKSRLAAEVAMQHAEGALWYRCTAGEVDLLSMLIKHLDMAPDAKEQQILDRLKQRPKTLIVIDNAEDVPNDKRPQYLDWISKLQSAGAYIILTSRLRWEEIRPFREISPGDLEHSDAARIALDFAVAQDIQLTALQADELATAARRYPRLIEWAVGQLEIRPLERVLEQLQKLTSKGLKEALDEMISRTLEQMRHEEGPAPERLLRCLVVCQGTFNYAILRAVKADEMDEDALDEALDKLVKWRFLRYEQAEARYLVEEMVRVVLPTPDETTFLRYADYVIELVEQFSERPPEAWADLDAEAGHIRAVGDALASGDRADPRRGERARRFAHAIIPYLNNRREVRRPEWLEMGLALAREDGEQGRQARFLNALGLAWNALGERDKALGYYEQSLALSRAVGDRDGEAAALNNIGAVWDALGERDKALGYYEQSLALRRAVGDKGGEATTLNNIGGVWYDLGERDKALGYYEQSLALKRAVGDKGGEATTLNNIGGVWDALGERDKALRYYEQSLALYHAVGDRGGEAGALNNIGGVWDALGERDKALGYYEQSLALYRAVGDKRGEAGALNNIGKVWYALGERDKALGYYEQSLALYRAVGDKGGEAVALNNIGGVWNALGERDKALGYYEQSLALYRAVGDKRGEAVALGNIGVVWNALGERDKALGYYEQSLALKRAVGDRGGEAGALNNMALIYFQEGDLSRAADILRQIIPVCQAIGAIAEEALFRANLGITLERLDQLDEAIGELEQAIALLKSKGLPRDASGETVAAREAQLAEWKRRRDGG